MFQVGKIVLGETKPTWKIPFELIKQSERINALIKENEKLKADKAELVDALRYKCGRMSVTERIEGEWGWDNRAEKILTKHTEAKS